MLVAITVVVSNYAALGDSVTIPKSVASFTGCKLVVLGMEVFGSVTVSLVTSLSVVSSLSVDSSLSVVTSPSVVTSLTSDSSVVVCTSSSLAYWLGIVVDFSGGVTVAVSLLGSVVVGLAGEGSVVVGLA